MEQLLYSGGNECQLKMNCDFRTVAVYDADTHGRPRSRHACVCCSEIAVLFFTSLLALSALGAPTDRDFVVRLLPCGGPLVVAVGSFYSGYQPPQSRSCSPPTLCSGPGSSCRAFLLFHDHHGIHHGPVHGLVRAPCLGLSIRRVCGSSQLSQMCRCSKISLVDVTSHGQSGHASVVLHSSPEPRTRFCRRTIWTGHKTSAEKVAGPARPRPSRCQCLAELPVLPGPLGHVPPPHLHPESSGWSSWS